MGLLSSPLPAQHHDVHGQLQLVRLALYELVQAERQLGMYCDVLGAELRKDASVIQLLSFSSRMLQECRADAFQHMRRCSLRIQLEGTVIPALYKPQQH